MIIDVSNHENNTFQLKFLFEHQNCRSQSFGRFVGVRVGVAPCAAQEAQESARQIQIA